MIFTVQTCFRDTIKIFSIYDVHDDNDTLQ